MDGQKLYIRTFGCQMNEYDSDRMAEVLGADSGTQPAQGPEDADLILFNTCSVRDKAQHKMYSELGRMKELKRANPRLLIGVGGCVASQEGERILESAPFVDLVFGPQTLHRLPQLIERRRASGKPQVDISFPAIEKFDALPPARAGGATAFVSIMEGCSKFCSFCVVPYTRGPEVSRPLDDVLTEVAGLADQGVGEITLLGQNVNAWRAPLPGTGAAQEADFALLLEYASEIPGIERIRYTTSHPKEFTQRLVDAHGRLPKLATHVHLPVQSGSDRVLAAMKRGYTVLEYKSIVRRLRAARPDISLGSDFIVGFPGETEADFAQTLRLVEELRFDTSFSFVYSRRPGTPAAELPDELDPDTRSGRLQRLQAALDAQERAHSQAMVGRVERVLVERSSRKDAGELAARTDNNRMVNFRGPADLRGRWIDLRITAAHARSLRGELIAS